MRIIINRILFSFVALLTTLVPSSTISEPESLHSAQTAYELCENREEDQDDYPCPFLDPATSPSSCCRMGSADPFPSLTASGDRHAWKDNGIGRGGGGRGNGGS
jgi:hypothetical protein